MKKVQVLLAILGITMLMVGLGAMGAPLNIAIILPSSVNDGEWSQGIYQDLLALVDEYGEDNLEIAYSENMWNIADADVAARDYAAEGYALVIGHGGQFGNTLIEVAKDFPGTSFAIGTDGTPFMEEGLANFFGYDASADEVGYVVGGLAAQLSESGVVGLINPIQSGDVAAYEAGFTAGAKAANPDIEILSVWTGSYSDSALASEAAQTMVASGADILTGTSQAVVAAMGVARDNGALWFGMRINQSYLAPETVALSSVYDWKVCIRPMIESIKAGVLGGELYDLNLANGGLYVVVHEGALFGKTIQGIIDGSINSYP